MMDDSDISRAEANDPEDEFWGEPVTLSCISSSAPFGANDPMLIALAKPMLWSFGIPIYFVIRDRALSDG